ncbi:helix-turn-helix domain-containing protein [Haloprofundus salilacus]
MSASLGVSQPTFHQHRRKAEKKVFDALLDRRAVSVREKPPT